MVVQNKTGKDLKIPEIKRIVPSDGKKYVVPYNIAIKYKQYLTPVQLNDRPITEDVVKKIKDTQYVEDKQSFDTKITPEINAEQAAKIDELMGNIKPSEEEQTSTEEPKKKLNLQQQAEVDREIIIKAWNEGNHTSKKALAKDLGFGYQKVSKILKGYK